MELTGNFDNQTFQQWIAERLNPEEVEKRLTSWGISEENIRLKLREYKRQFYSKRRFAGFLMMSIGAFLGFISCVLSVFNPVPELYGWFLYGLTSIAIVLAVWGLFFVME